MKTMVTLAATAAMFLMGSGVHAQGIKEKAATGGEKVERLVDKGLSSQGLKNQGLYGELGLSFLNYKISSIGFSSRPMALRGMVGYDVYPHLAVEGMLATGLRNGRGTGLYGTGYHYSAGTMLGAYVKPQVQLGDLTLFGRIGLASTSASVGGYGGTVDGAGISYGGGLNYQTSLRSFGGRPISLNADYMSYYSGSGVKYNGFTVGAGMSF